MPRCLSFGNIFLAILTPILLAYCGKLLFLKNLIYSLYLDSQTKTITASGNPHEILKNPPNERVFQFLTRGKNNEKGTE